MKKKILYISLTGMTEALGRSQVLEYLIDLNISNEIYLISFERESDLENLNMIETMIKDHNIVWNKLVYSNKYGILSTCKQILTAVFLSCKIIKKYNIQIIHARSIIPATIGLLLKKLYKIPLIFDIRGFAIDEKVDSGRLKANSYFFKILKCIDNLFYKKADHIVTLTYQAKKILINNLSISENKITVIPTCANNKVFKTLTLNERIQCKLELGFNENDIIFIHTGTVSGWYDFEKELMLLKQLMLLDNRIRFLILNKNEQKFIEDLLEKYQIKNEKVIVKSVKFEEVYKYLNISRYSIFFIKPSYSKQASSPTKFAENVACLLPSITNSNVGDMEYYMCQYDVGMLFDLNNFNVEDISRKIIRNLDKIYDSNIFEQLFFKHFNKESAVRKYEGIYQKLI